jgi:hypothetical protein
MAVANKEARFLGAENTKRGNENQKQHKETFHFHSPHVKFARRF